MQRKEAEKLLAALIFDDLDEPSKTELLTYLQSDDELRERLADMRMAVKVTSDTVQHGPEPVLGKRRLKRLARLAKQHRSQPTIFTMPRLAAAAAIFIIAALGPAMVLINMWASSKKEVVFADVMTDYDGRGVAYDMGYHYAHGEPPLGTAGEQMSGRYGYDAAARSPVAVDTGGGTIVTGPITNDGRLFAKAKEDIGEIIGVQTVVLSGDAPSSGKPAPTEKWASADHLESKPDSGVRNGGAYGGGGYGGGYGRMGESSKTSGPGGIGGNGGMGGTGKTGYSGGAGGDVLGGAMYFDADVENGDKLTVYGGTYNYNGDIKFRGGKEITVLTDNLGVAADTIIDSQDGVSGFTLSNGRASGTETDTYQDSSQQQRYDEELGRLKNLLAQGSYYNDALTSKDTLDDMVHFKKEIELEKDSSQRGDSSRTDNFPTIKITHIDGEPVTVARGVPVLSKIPKLTPSSKPKSNVSGPSDLPALKLPAEGTESNVVWYDTKNGRRFEDSWERFEDSWGVKAHNKNEAVFGELNAGLGTKGPQLVGEKAKPSVLPDGKVAEESRKGDVSKEKGEVSIDDSKVTPATGAEEHIKEFLESTDEIESLLDKAQIAGHDSLAHLDESSVKRESGRVPILGNIPIVGGMFRSDGGRKRPLSEEEKKRVVEYFKALKSQPEGESTSAGIPTKRFVEHLEGGKSKSEGEPVEPEYEIIQLKYADPREVEDSIEDGFRDLPGTQFSPKVSIEPLPQSQQIIVFGRKDMREKVKNMVQEIDRPSGPSVADCTIVPVGEDETDLPPALRFKLVPVNPWVMAERDSLSTFALDVDTASYTLCRRYIRGGFLPPAGAVRMEEFVNYFNYNYPQRTNPTFTVHAEAAASPFAGKDKNLTLLKIGVKARTIGRDQRKAAHLIFVVDASASMGQPDRLPFVQQALDLLVSKLSVVDRVSLITCANEARLHLEAAPARERDRIRRAIYAVQPAGPTNLLAGLKLGYATARRSFAPKQINHVVLCSDGVANVGQTEAEAVLEEVAADRKQGITITCVGVGYGSYNDVFMESLANRGDGSYMFLDSARQTRQVFVEQLAATLQTVAKDARIQVDFNPHRVRRYRLVGYENRDIEDKRFRDDTIDAGEVGSGQCSTALYELELIGHPSADRQGDLGTVFVRYRDVETGQIEEISSRLSSASVRRHTVASAPRFFLAAGAARFAEILRQSEHAQHGNLTDVLRVAEQVSLALPLDRDVRELAELIRKAEHLPRAP